jgi:hypothetical protein
MISVFIKTIGTIAIDLSLAVPAIICFVYASVCLDDFNIILVILFMFIPFCVYFLYLIFSNTKYISLSCLFLKYRLIADDHQFARLIASNIVFYTILSIYIFLQAKHIDGLLYNIIRILLTIELGACFVPKIGRRLSLFLLKIQWKTINNTTTGIKMHSYKQQGKLDRETNK